MRNLETQKAKSDIFKNEFRDFENHNSQNLKLYSQSGNQVDAGTEMQAAAPLDF